jgi:hypothetical protein
MKRDYATYGKRNRSGIRGVPRVKPGGSLACKHFAKRLLGVSEKVEGERMMEKFVEGRKWINWLRIVSID